MLVSIMHKHIHDPWCMFPGFTYSCIHDAWSMHCMNLWCIYMWCMHVCLMHVCMILVWCTYFWSWSRILIHACIHDAYICDAAEILLWTNGQGNSRSWMIRASMIHVSRMHPCHINTWCTYAMHGACTRHAHINFPPWSWCMCVWSYTFDPWPLRVHIWWMCVWCIYLWSLTLIIMDISLILDPWPWCIYAYPHCKYPWSLTLMHISIMRQILWRTDGLTDKPILGVWCTRKA